MEKGGITTQCVRLRAKLAVTVGNKQGTHFTHCRGATPMPIEESYLGQ
jgi:hypothetical protein